MYDILIGTFLDLILGDPYFFPHPVRLMGKIITFEEKVARRRAKTPRGLRRSGLIIVCINMALAFFVPYFSLRLLAFNALLFKVVNIYLIYSMISARCLHKEAALVVKALGESLEKGRNRLSHIVGRDTTNLNEEEIIRASVETVAENTSDGVIAPLLYLMISVPLGVVYKFVNTMDSMLGYKNDDYIDLGYYPAKIDDFFNLVPARITALLMIFSSFFRFDGKNGLKILKRDKKNHESPNSGYPESAVSGLLGIQLGGSHLYKGVLVEKPTIGDRQVDTKTIHVKHSIQIMYRSQISFIIIYIVIWLLIK